MTLLVLTYLDSAVPESVRIEKLGSEAIILGAYFIYGYDEKISDILKGVKPIVSPLDNSTLFKPVANTQSESSLYPVHAAYWVSSDDAPVYFHHFPDYSLAGQKGCFFQSCYRTQMHDRFFEDAHEFMIHYTTEFKRCVESFVTGYKNSYYSVNVNYLWNYNQSEFLNIVNYMNGLERPTKSKTQTKSAETSPVKHFER